MLSIIHRNKFCQ